ncbi:unnamed protein product [Adineta steineri]|uniref:N-acetyltransferase domain-containing protein n=1 Tax=Adineta steineri TaxID=433720 RepID=A0A819SKZ9_9BILA|nr:unnamed protein product [Adineta steineri]
MDNRFILRRAIDTDNVTLAELNQQTFIEAYVEDLAIPFSEEQLQSYFRTSVSPQYFAKKIADSQQSIWVVEDKTSGELVAFANVGRCEIFHPESRIDEDGEIYRLYVRRNYQGYGLGRWLMNVILSWFEEQYPRRPIWLGVWIGNLKAQNLYKHYNFYIVGDREFDVGGYKCHSKIMRRDSSLS